LTVGGADGEPIPRDAPLLANLAKSILRTAIRR